MTEPPIQAEGSPRTEQAAEAAAPGGLREASLAQLFLYGLGLADVPEGIPLGVLLGLRVDLDALAQLALVASENGSEQVSLSLHIGKPLEGLVRRLDVAIELLEREARGRASSP
jgi:hypothetical protein